MNQFLSWTSPQWPTFPSLFNPCEMKPKRIVPESPSCSLAGWWSEFYHGFHTRAWRNGRKLEIRPHWSTLSRKQSCTSCCGQHVWITIKGDTRRSLPGQHAQRSDIQRAHQHGQSHSRSLSLDHLFGCLGRNRLLLVAIFKQLVWPVTPTPQMTWYLVTNMDQFLYHWLSCWYVFCICTVHNEVVKSRHSYLGGDVTWRKSSSSSSENKIQLKVVTPL